MQLRSTRCPNSFRSSGAIVDIVDRDEFSGPRAQHRVHGLDLFRDHAEQAPEGFEDAAVEVGVVFFVEQSIAGARRRRPS